MRVLVDRERATRGAGAVARQVVRERADDLPLAVVLADGVPAVAAEPLADRGCWLVRVAAQHAVLPPGCWEVGRTPRAVATWDARTGLVVLRDGELPLARVAAGAALLAVRWEHHPGLAHRTLLELLARDREPGRHDLDVLARRDRDRRAEERAARRAAGQRSRLVPLEAVAALTSFGVGLAAHGPDLARTAGSTASPGHRLERHPSGVTLRPLTPEEDPTAILGFSGNGPAVAALVVRHGLAWREARDRSPVRPEPPWPDVRRERERWTWRWTDATGPHHGYVVGDPDLARATAAWACLSLVDTVRLLRRQ